MERINIPEPAKPRQKSRQSWANAGLIVLFSALVGLGSIEVGLRILTDFPVSFRTNRVADVNLGYRLDPSLRDVDANGFRNSGMEQADAEVFAVGDSHTYGNNVDQADSWPAVLGRISGRRVYNTGVGSYGIATYHAVLSRILTKHTAVAIVAVYPANDFLPRASFCEIDFESPFWSTETKRINLQLGVLQNDCSNDENRRKGFSTWARGNVALEHPPIMMDHILRLISPHRVAHVEC